MTCRLEAKVVPGASRTELAGWLGSCLKIRVAAPPEKGKANQAVITLLAGLLGVDKKSVVIVQGASSQRKVIEIHGMTRQQLDRVLPAGPA